MDIFRYHWNIATASPRLFFVTFWLALGAFLLLFGRVMSRYGRPPRSPRPVVLIWVVGFLLLQVGGWLVGSGLRLAAVEYSMARGGQVADAFVRERAVRTDPGEWESRPRRDYVAVVFEFRDEAGRLRRVEREVEEGRAWTRSRPGDPAPVIEYLRDDPEVWRFADEAGLWGRLVLAGGAAGAAAVGLRILCGLVSRAEPRRCT